MVTESHSVKSVPCSLVLEQLPTAMTWFKLSKQTAAGTEAQMLPLHSSDQGQLLLR